MNKNITAVNHRKFKLPAEASIALVLIGVIILFEALGWYIADQSFIFNLDRVKIIILQMSVIGIIAIGVNMCIITGGIDLSSGSLVAATAVVSATFAQSADFSRIVYPILGDLPWLIPVIVGVLVGVFAGLINGLFISYTAIPPFIATLGMMVSARGFAKWFSGGMPVSGLTDDFAAVGAGSNPVYYFLILALSFHILLRYTRFGKFTYAIGANRQAAIVSGINVRRHLVYIYVLAGMLSGIAGVLTASRTITGQASMGNMYELDAIAAVVIGGTSLAGGKGKITGTIFGVLILGVMLSGFTFIRVDVYYQEMVKGMIIIGAVVADQYRNRNQRK